MTARPMTAALAVFQRRAMLAAVVRVLLVVLLLTALMAEAAAIRSDLFDQYVIRAIAALTIAGIVGSGIVALRRRPRLIDVARRLDRVARLQDLMVTAVGCERGTDQMSLAIVGAARVAVARIAPAEAYPLGVPRQWRRWAMLAAAAQVAAIGIAWRAPAARLMPASLSSLAMPAAGGDERTASPQTASTPGADAPATPGLSATASERAVASPLPDAGRDASASAAPRDAATTGSGLAPAAPPTSAPGASGTATANSDNRYSQPPPRTGGVTPHGRVPAALRRVVERYFAAIR